MIVHDVSRLIALTLVTTSAGGCGWLFACGKDESYSTPLSVSDWNVTPATYANIVARAKEVGGSDGLDDSATPDPGETGDTGDTGETGDTGDTGDTGVDTMAWDELDATQQCNLACAFAVGEADVYLTDYQYADTLTINTCALTIPTADADGTLSCTATFDHRDICIGGRRPLGWQAQRAPITCAQQQLDGIAVMEQVSITAFMELAAQLEARGGPAELVARCRAAALDERRHVELVVELGAARPKATLEPAAATTLLAEIALHNAVEGCVTETWAALLARHQAEHAPELRVREAFEQIAADEARHAQLAWELHAYFMQVLEPGVAREVERARARALAGLERTASQQALAVPREVREALGLPEPRVAGALASDFGWRLAQRPAA
ncbi:ferritin-like domain-containing protein [Enhygromyxa salina]|uniref:Uncharacterized protein n=1 Tax=Enhygromyxa salina TaxID=215803 RepID=A0A2S9XQK1_9BACT|nr:ferritin-like domain-containing protein [Enhygromyxa salina]PRP95135.1 hypothetical protein ENSA7_74490 [Enhygromyxa salina]